MSSNGGKLSCVGGNSEIPTSGPVPRTEDLAEQMLKLKVIRDGDRLVSKSSYAKRKLNLGVEVRKSDSGFRLSTANELGTSKEIIYRPVEEDRAREN